MLRALLVVIALFSFGCTENMQHTNAKKTVAEGAAVGASVGLIIGALTGDSSAAKAGAATGAVVGAALGGIVADVQGAAAKREKSLRTQINSARATRSKLRQENAKLRRLISQGKAKRTDFRKQIQALNEAKRKRRTLASLRPKARTPQERR